MPSQKLYLENLPPGIGYPDKDPGAMETFEALPNFGNTRSSEVVAAINIADSSQNGGVPGSTSRNGF
jgi:hypothetical protein